MRIRFLNETAITDRIGTILSDDDKPSKSIIRLLSNQLLHYYCYLNFEVELVTVVCSQSLLHIRFLNTVTNFDPSDVELSLRLVIECDVFVI